MYLCSQAATFNMLMPQLRHSLFIFLAAPAAALLSYSAVKMGDPNPFDTFGMFLFYFTLSMQLLMAVLFFNNFFFRHRWSMDYW